MRSDSKLPVVIMVLAGLVLLGWLASSIIGSKQFPSLQDYIASSTPQASSTPAAAATTDAVSDGGVSEPDPMIQIPLHAPRGAISVLVASTSADQQQGLGDRASLPSDEGMLFPFVAPGEYGFWMLDMRFPLDMVWIGPDKTVAGVARDVSPDSYPAVLFPPSPISYVLEINAGSALELGIATGTKLSF